MHTSSARPTVAELAAVDQSSPVRTAAGQLRQVVAVTKRHDAIIRRCTEALLTLSSSLTEDISHIEQVLKAVEALANHVEVQQALRQRRPKTRNATKTSELDKQHADWENEGGAPLTFVESTEAVGFRPFSTGRRAIKAARA